MVKKAPRRNAYFMFMLDYKRREESRGIRFGNGLQDVSKLASDAWKSLPQDEKDRYKKRADDYNKSEKRSQGWPGGSKKKKSNPHPVPPNRALTIKEAKQRKEKLFIQNLVENMTITALLDHPFYLIHVNVFCTTLDGEFVPAEIGISRFSLREGVTDVFHRILGPGVTPLGYSYEIKIHSEKTHRIPLDYIKATNGYLGMYKGITDFLRQGDDSSDMPPLYTMFDEPFHNCSMSAVKYSLKRIWETYPLNDDDDEDGEIEDDEKYEKTFPVMSLPILFFHLKNKCASMLDENVVAFDNTSEANIQLLNDRYEFNEELACQFHKDIDNVRYCSQSYTVRWAQVIREQCIKNLESDDEEEEQEVVDEEEKINRERELAIKEEKARIRAEESDRKIKTERDIKKEKYDARIKKEKDDKNNALKKEKDDENYALKKEKDDTNHALKKEKDDIRVKKEKDDSHREIKKEKDEVGIKQEKSGSQGESSHSRAIKSERDFDQRSRTDRDHRSYDDVRVKNERDERSRRCENVHIKSERDDCHKRNEDVCVKNERDIEHRSSEGSSHVRYKTEKCDPEYDSLLKTEHFDIPFKPENDRYESRDSRDSYKYSDSSNDSCSSRKTSRSDYEPRIKSERHDSRDPRSYSRSSEERSHPEYSSKIKTERSDIPFDIKSERYDSQDSHSRYSHRSQDSTRSEYNSAIKTEHLDIPLRIKSEHRDRDPRSGRETTRPDYDSILKTEHVDIPFDIESERYDTRDSTNKYSEAARNSRLVSEPCQSPPKRIKIERSEASSTSHSNDFLIPIPIKTEPSLDKAKTSNDSNFPLPKPIKVEKDSHTDFPMPIKIEPDSQINEGSSRTQRDNKSDKHIFPVPIPIKMEKDETSKTSKSTEKGIPMPIIIKTEKPSERSQPVESSQRNKSTEKGILMPIIIKTEKPSELSQPVESSQRSNDFPLPIQIKIEKDARSQEEKSTCDTLKSRKRTRDSEEEDLRSSAVKIKIEREIESVSDVAVGNIRIKNEPLDSHSNDEMKHEQFDIEPDAGVVRQEHEIKKEKL